jgi:hypothetical protein
VEAVVVVLRTKFFPTWSVPTTAALEGALFPLGGVVAESRHHSVHHFRVKTQIWLAGLDDGGVS